MKRVTTRDNTETFINLKLNESYHSHTGAVEEALRKYAIPCKIKELAKKGKIRILDMFFGLGYNSAMAIDVALNENPDCEIEVIGIEHDPKIIEKIQEVNPPIKSYRHFKKITLRYSQFREGNVTVKVVLGDARETVRNLGQKSFDAVFFDPFSPKTQPEMWSIELFQQMNRVMKKSAILATYSCARLARDNISKAGLMYDDGPMVGRRGPGTIAWRWDL